MPDIETRYVAYCDILGFSNKVLSEFDATLDVYRQFGENLAKLPMEEVEVTMYSDSILVTSKSLARVLSAVQTLWFVSLFHDLMIRGAIAKGKYWQLRQGNHLLMASDALVRAVRLEGEIGVPAVVIADDIEIGDEIWVQRFAHGLLATPVLHFRDRNIVNPFNSYWFASASTRTKLLMQRSPDYSDKYLWFLALHEAVASGSELVPPIVLQRLLERGVLKRIV